MARYHLTIEIENESPRQAAEAVLKGMTADLRKRLLQSFKGIVVIDADAGAEYHVKLRTEVQAPVHRTIDGDVLVYANYNVGSISVLYAMQTLGDATILSRALHAQQFEVKVRQWNGVAYDEVKV